MLKWRFLGICNDNLSELESWKEKEKGKFPGISSVIMIELNMEESERSR